MGMRQNAAQEYTNRLNSDCAVTYGPRLRVMAHLLVVDDDNDLVEGFGELLRGEGHEVRTASTGEEGLDVLSAAPLPDALILDVDMPVLGGPGMAHRMLLHDAGEQYIPILLMSARTDLPQIAEQMGTPYFHAKTGDIGAFLSLLDRVLRERRAPRPHDLSAVKPNEQETPCLATTPPD
jgi:CheY-like chemotaxis protein